MKKIIMISILSLISVLAFADGANEDLNHVPMDPARNALPGPPPNGDGNVQSGNNEAGSTATGAASCPSCAKFQKTANAKLRWAPAPAPEALVVNEAAQKAKGKVKSDQ